MSRTYRRKNLKRNWFNFKNEDHFDFIKQLHDSGNPYPEQHRGWSGWLPEAPQEIQDHWEADSFKIFSRQKHSYGDYVSHENAMFHSDRGWHHGGALWRGMGGRLNGADRKIEFERPFRQAMKRLIHHSVVDDAWDGLVVPEFKSRGWWMYYN